MKGKQEFYKSLNPLYDAWGEIYLKQLTRKSHLIKFKLKLLRKEPREQIPGRQALKLLSEYK